MSFAVVVLSRNVTNLAACVAGLRECGETAPLIVVDDGLAHRQIEASYVDGVRPFIFARNANLGLRAAWDVAEAAFLLNDDAVLASERGFTQLDERARRHPELGLVSAAVTDAVGNLRQKPQHRGLRREERTLAFVCVWIPKTTWDAIGPLDEAFDDYGGEDNDWCIRTKAAGLGLAIDDVCIVRHGELPSTFRGHGARDITAAIRRLQNKWGRLA